MDRAVESFRINLDNVKRSRSDPETSREILATIIVLDQFSRHIHRGTPEAYANDKKAVGIVVRNLSRVLCPTFYGDGELSSVEKMFYLMPLQHSESLADQTLGVRVLTILRDRENDPDEKKIMDLALRHQIQHRDTLRRFGRFPKRNEILGRRSRPSEIRYIQEENLGLPY